MKTIASMLTSLVLLAGAVAPAAAQKYYDDRQTYSYGQEYQTDSYNRDSQERRGYSYNWDGRDGETYFYGNDSQFSIRQLDQDGRGGHQTGGGRPIN